MDVKSGVVIFNIERDTIDDQTDQQIVNLICSNGKLIELSVGGTRVVVRVTRTESETVIKGQRSTTKLTIQFEQAQG